MVVLVLERALVEMKETFQIREYRYLRTRGGCRTAVEVVTTYIQSNEQTIHQMTSFFNSINLILAPHEFPECYRTPEKPALEGRAKKVPIIILRFNSIGNMRKLFTCMAVEGVKPCFPNVNFANSIPKSLQESYQKASKKSYEIRSSKREPNKPKTKIEIDKQTGEIKLYVKSKGAKLWKNQAF